MKSTLKKTKGSVITGEITLTTDEFRPHWDAVYEGALGKVQVPGFRAGAAPRELASKHINVEAVFQEVANRAVRDSLQKLTEEKEWRIIEGPSVEILEASPLTKDGKKKEDGFKYRATFTIFPEVILGDYKKIARKVLATRKPAEVTLEELESSLKWLRDSRAALATVSRPAALGDVIEADIESFLGDGPLPGGKLVGDRFLLGESRFMPGFDDRLVGKNKGEELTFTLAAPADYWNEAIKGKEVRFSVHIKEIFSRTLPALDDAFATSLGKEFKTIEDVRTSLKDGLLVEKEKKEEDAYRAKMIEAITKESEIDVPAPMIERTLDGLVEEVAPFMQQGKEQMDKEKLRESLRPKAEARAKGYLVIHAIANKEGLEPTKEEVLEEVARQGVDQNQVYDYSYGIVRNKKVFAFLESSH